MSRYKIGTYNLKIEQYAKKYNITIAKAIVYFMLKEIEDGIDKRQDINDNK